MWPVTSSASSSARQRYTLPFLVCLFVSSYPGAMCDVCVCVCVYTHQVVLTLSFGSSISHTNLSTHLANVSHKLSFPHFCLCIDGRMSRETKVARRNFWILSVLTLIPFNFWLIRNLKAAVISQKHHFQIFPSIWSPSLDFYILVEYKWVSEVPYFLLGKLSTFFFLLQGTIYWLSSNSS